MCARTGEEYGPCGRARSQGRRVHAVIEGRAGAGQITIQLRGGSHSKLSCSFTTHTITKVPPQVGHANDSSARACPCKYTHTQSNTRFFPFFSPLLFILAQRMRRREPKMGKQECGPSSRLPHRAALPRNVFFSLLSLFKASNFFPQPEIPKFRGCAC